MTLWLFGCSNDDDRYQKIDKNFIPKEDHYALYSIGKEIDFHELSEKHVLTHFQKGIYDESLEVAKERLPSVSIKTNETPYFIVFDKDGVVLKTHDLKDAIKLIKNH